MKKQWKILVVDDEPAMRESMAAWLNEDGYTVEVASSGPEAIELCRALDYAMYFVDLKMPGMDGIETMSKIRELHPHAAMVIITAYATVDNAITAMKEGARDYIVKPCSPQEISMLVERTIEVKKLERENQLLRKKLTKQFSFHDIVSKSPRMSEIFDLIREVAGLPSTVLIQGDSGTGKELIARALHHEGDRAGKRFVAVSCASLAESLLETELFGHEAGAFTGAQSQRKGKFEIADGGTLFLDEIGDMSPKLQVDLLRVLQERRFFRVGGTEEIQVDVRVIAATHRDLAERVREGKVREDLYYRLNVIAIEIPPLSQRLEDVPLLARHFLERIALELASPVSDITDGALRFLMNQPWPGNVRELENAIERAIVTCRDQVLEESDFAFMAQAGEASGWRPPPNLTLRELERQAIAATLERTAGNIKEAARVLGIDRSTLYDKLKRYDMPRPTAAKTEL